LKNNKIKDDFTAQGIDKARQILSFDKLSDEEKNRYWRRVEERRIKDSEIETAFIEGETKGFARGEAKGFAKGEAERAQLKAELKEKETELLARIAALEQQLSETRK